MIMSHPSRSLLFSDVTNRSRAASGCNRVSGSAHAYTVVSNDVLFLWAVNICIITDNRFLSFSNFQIKPCSASACADIQSSHADIQFRLIFSANNTVETILLPVSQGKADHRGRGVQPFTIIENKRWSGWPAKHSIKLTRQCIIAH